jgi:hypothetical protein
MKKILFLIIIVLLFEVKGFSQVRANQGASILFHGLVLDASTLTPVSNTQIVINRSASSISGSDGSFAFYVNRNDTVVFKRLGYKRAVYMVSDTLQGEEFLAGIYMKTDSLEIPEVIIIPRFSNLKSDIMNGKSRTPSTFDNAKYNVAVSAYQGRTTQGQLGDPANNYALLKQKQKTDAYERGGIPSDKILGLSPLLLIPAAYLLVKGVPEKPAPMPSTLSNRDIDEINQKYLETIRKRK